MHVEAATCLLVSRKDDQFQTFPGLCEWFAAALGGHDAILDSRIVALDAAGRAQFNPLLYRRGDPHSCPLAGRSAKMIAGLGELDIDVGAYMPRI